MRVDRVLIVGAGIAGLALARKLHSVGIAFDILERRERADVQGAAILLTGNAVRALQTLGVHQTLFERSRRVNVIRFTDERERLLFELDCSSQPTWPPFVSIERAALQETLLDTAERIAPRWGATLVSMEESLDVVDITLKDGTRARYDLVVGADGVHSQLRKLMFGSPPIEPIAGFFGWRFLAPCPARLETPQYMLGNGCTLLLHPLPGGKVYCGAGPISETRLNGPNDRAQLLGAFSMFGGLASEVLASAAASPSLIATRYWHVEQRSWRTGRCVLIGDAAHACAPTLAQGGAMALEDALVLGDLLAEGNDLAETLCAFELRRRPRVAHAQSRSLQRMEVNRPLDSRALAVRNAVLSQVGATQLLDAWAPLMERSP